MTEKYSNFDSPATDKAPIVPDITFIKNLNIKVREIILGVALFIAIIVCIALVAVLASKSDKKIPPAPTNPYEKVCVSGPCLKSASYIIQNMNRSVNPCENFHQYACGRFKENFPLDAETSSRSLTYNLYYDNQLRIEKLLESPVERADEWSAERKLKHLFASCTDTYRKDSARGTPIITKLLPHIGGWYVLGTFDENSFNFQQALQKVNVDFWTPVLFTFRLLTDTWANTNRKVIEVDYSGMSMYWFYYTSPSTEKYRTDYKKFMRTIGNYLVRDSNITLDNHTQTQRINQWMEDAYFIESQLANITQHTQSSPGDPHEEENRVTIRQLTQQTNNAIDFVAFFKYLFNNAAVNENTRIIVHEPDWINKMTAFVNGLGTNKNRMMNNYFVWRLLYRYRQELSWDYIHANRDFYVDRFGIPEFLGTWRYCFYTMSNYVGDALSSEFVKTHFADKNKEKAHEILKHVKDEIVSRITDIRFMDTKTKSAATAKINAVLDKIGYPDFMMDMSHMDSLYSSLSVDKEDYFENLLNINKFLRSDMNKQLASDDAKSRWIFHTYDTYMYYSNAWNEILIPAGLLQFPFYDHELPRFNNFGSIGSVMAHYLIHAIDQIGGYYNKDGKYSRWWSNYTNTEYTKAKKCVSDYFSNQTMGPYNIPGSPTPVPIPVNGASYAMEGMAERSGVSVAYKAYKMWEKKNGGEKTAPGFNLSNEQMFFLSFAQTYCYARNDNTAYSNAIRGITSEDVRLNGIMAQMEEFATAFNCPDDSKMTVKKRCDFY